MATTKLLVQPYRSFSTPNYTNRTKQYSSRYAFRTPIAANNAEITTTTSSSSNDVSYYQDSWFDSLAINHLSRTIQATTGFRNNKSGYKGVVEAARAVYRNYNSTEQKNLVVETLQQVFPKPILSLIRMLLPQSKWGREYCATFTTIFFAWLVGPCHVKESEFNGRIEKNVVHIKKCRFLEETNCVGMCTNLCKMPSQVFIKDSLGMPVNMVPNFDDMSCEMIFGQDPLPLATDPAFTQPCYEICILKKKHLKTLSSQ